MEELIKEYESQLRLDGKSEKTIRAYTVSMREYFKWFYDSFGDVEYKNLLSLYRVADLFLPIYR